MTKEIWIDEWERLEDELGREPTDDEIHDAYSDRIGDLIDQVRDRRKERDL